MAKIIVNVHALFVDAGAADERSHSTFFHVAQLSTSLGLY